jgi:hypothetical protein
MYVCVWIYDKARLLKEQNEMLNRYYHYYYYYCYYYYEYDYTIYTDKFYIVLLHYFLYPDIRFL